MGNTVIDFEIGVPKKCLHCKMTPEKMLKKYGMQWMAFRIPDTTIMFMQCPNCNGIMGNTKALTNTLKLKKIREDEARKIIPATVKDIADVRRGVLKN